MSKNMNQYLGLNSFSKLPDGTELTHREKYGRVVNGIGLDTLIPLIPATLEQVKEALETGEGHLNEIPIKLWDNKVPVVRSLMHRKLGINVSSLSQGVCVLKEAAKQWVEWDGDKC